MPRGIADIVEVVVLAAGANIKVGSLRGTSGDDGTIACPFFSK
jgi:hypothetical protein